MAEIELIGVGSPVVDLLAHVDEAFVAEIDGGKGGMELVDAVALSGLVGKLTGEPAQAAGGSAGNTAFAAGKLGTKVGFVGKLGNCETGQFYKDRFAEIGADLSRFKVGEVANAKCLSLVTPDSERTMRTDLGAAMTLAPEEISVEDFKGAKHVHMEGYLLFNRELMKKVLDSAKEAGCTTSLDMASFEVVRASEEVLPGWLKEHVDIVFANEDEAAAYFPDHGDDHQAMAAAFADICEVAAVKLGKDGSLISKGGEVEFVEPIVIEQATDTTGAGDYWAGGFLHGWLQGKPLEICGRYGSILGAEVVQVLGASLPAERWAELVGKLDSYGG
ncbi:MAG: adenosine kinase [Verrucomicrobiota bacterium]